MAPCGISSGPHRRSESTPSGLSSCRDIASLFNARSGRGDGALHWFVSADWRGCRCLSVESHYVSQGVGVCFRQCLKLVQYILLVLQWCGNTSDSNDVAACCGVCCTSWSAQLLSATLLRLMMCRSACKDLQLVQSFAGVKQVSFCGLGFWRHSWW